MKWFFLCCVLAANAHSISPVMKVVELLDECKAKVAKDIAAETTAMEEYTSFCDDELKDKAYAIETTTREIRDYKATIAVQSDAIQELSTTMSYHDKDGYAVSTVR